MKVGKRVFMNRNCMLVSKSSIFIGDSTTIGLNVMIFDNDHNFRKIDNRSDKRYLTDEICIGQNVWIGANIVILRGFKIGDNCVIAAGAVIKENIPSGKIVYQDRNLIIKDIYAYFKLIILF